MKRFFITMLCVLCVFSLSAQELNSDYVYKANQQGDQFVKLDLALNIPARPKQLKMGGSGTLGYSRFITDNILIGGNASFAYTTTIADNVFYFVPIMVNGTYQFTVNKFEIPLTLGLGCVIQNYAGNQQNFGMVVKPEAGCFYRFSPDWSFGLQTGLYVMPQWFKESEHNYCGLIADVALSVRYHF